MPAQRLLILLGLFAICIAIVAVGAADGCEFYLFMLGGRHAYAAYPPTEPSLIIYFLLLLYPTIAYWSRRVGTMFFAIFAASTVLGSITGYFVFEWTPSWAQHVLTVAMIGTAVYAGGLKQD